MTIKWFNDSKELLKFIQSSYLVYLCYTKRFHSIQRLYHSFSLMVCDHLKHIITQTNLVKGCPVEAEVITSSSMLALRPQLAARRS